ncbi:MAG: SHOCT domain-containing protein [Pontiella sp.]
MKKTSYALIPFAVALLLTGCNITKVTATDQPGPIGQELLDLHEAHEKGIITDSEYQRLKNRILETTRSEDT